MRQGLSNDLITRILGGVPKYTIAELEEKFPARNLPDSAMVTRVAPSPTGFMHLGNFYQYLIGYKLAQQSGGVFYIRIEDTDTKREVAGAVDVIFETAKRFNMSPNEGPEQGGAYGPYFQSQRRDIYHSVVAELLARGHAYPCFLSATDMDAIRENQKAAGFPTGIYGEFARDRNITEAEISANLDAGLVPTIRLYSTGNPAMRIFCKDAVRGSISFPQNNEDIVLIKSNDGLPTYHFAHVIDDHFMRTTLVQRGEEWLPSLPLHIQLFQMMEWTPPLYIHTSTLDTIDVDSGNQRKLSKRKDPEANMKFFFEHGWPLDAVLEYLINIVSSGYEEAKAKGAAKNIWEYEIKPKKIPMSPALFDMKKLEWWARESIGAMSVDDLTAHVINWAREYSDEWSVRIAGGEDYLRAILSIERDNPKRVRKDFITWKQTLEEVAYFFDDIFDISDIRYQISDINILGEFLKLFEISDDKDTWWNKIVKIASSLGIKSGDAAMALRVALTGRTNAPDLYSIIQVMGNDRVVKRIKNAI